MSTPWPDPEGLASTSGPLTGGGSSPAWSLRLAAACTSAAASSGVGSCLCHLKQHDGCFASMEVLVGHDMLVHFFQLAPNQDSETVDFVPQ